jgi:WD40 repeat protein
MRAVSRLWLVVFCLLLLPIAVSGQDAPTQTFTSSDGQVTMRYPEGWTAVEEDGLIRFNGDNAFLQFNYRDYGEEVTAREVFDVGGRVEYGFSEAETLTIAGYAAIQARSVDQLRTVIDLCDGVIGIGIGFVNPDDLPTYEPVFMDILNSLRFGDGEPRVCAGAFTALQTITSSNAAQLTPLTTLGDPAASVTSLAFNPDGDQLAVGTADGVVHVWSMVTGWELLTLSRHSGGATSIAYGSGGNNLAVGTGRGDVRLWDATTGDGSGTMQQHQTAVTSVTFGQLFLVASGSVDGEVRLWDISRRAETGVLVDTGAATPVNSVAFDPNGARLVAGGGNTMRLWNVASMAVEAAFETDMSDIATLAFRPDGALVVFGGSDSTVWSWDLAGSPQPLLEGLTPPVFAVAYSSDGQLIATLDASGVRLWNTATGESLVALAGDSDQLPRALAFSPAGTLVATGGETGGAMVWAVSSASEPTEASTTGEAAPATTPTLTSGSGSCTISAPGNANLRGGPGTNYAVIDTLTAGQTAEVDGQAVGADGFTWFRLTSGGWVRGDVVTVPDACVSVPTVTP